MGDIYVATSALVACFAAYALGFVAGFFARGDE